MHGVFRTFRVKRRQYIRIGATPKTPEAQRLMAEFLRQVQAFERRWKAYVKGYKEKGRAK